MSCRTLDRVARRDALVAPILRQVELVLVGKPRQLRGKLVLLALRSDDRHRKAAFETAREHALHRPIWSI
jgi:hypothetical protein